MEKEIFDKSFLTPQEHLFVGSTPEVEPKKDNEWHIPELVTLGRIGIDEANRKREDIFHIKTSIMAATLGFENKSLIIKLQGLDPETGQTVADPEVIGIWDDNKRQMAEIETDNLDLTKKLFDKLHTYSETDYHLRQPGSLEGQKTDTERRI